MVFFKVVIDVGGPSPLWLVPLLSMWSWDILESRLADHDEQTNKQYISMVFAILPASRFLSYISTLTSLIDIRDIR